MICSVQLQKVYGTKHRFSNCVSRHTDLSRAAARCTVRNVNIYNAIPELSTKFVGALLTAEHHNLTLEFRERRRIVRARVRMRHVQLDRRTAPRSDMT